MYDDQIKSVQLSVESNWSGIVALSNTMDIVQDAIEWLQQNERLWAEGFWQFNGRLDVLEQFMNKETVHNAPRQQQPDLKKIEQPIGTDEEQPTLKEEEEAEPEEDKA